MDYIAQAMPYTKRALIAHKFFWPILTLVSGILIAATINYSLLATNVSPSYLYSLASYATFMLASLSASLAIFAFALMMGSLIGDGIVATVATVAAVLSAGLLFSPNMEYVTTAIIASYKGLPKEGSLDMLRTLFGLESTISTLVMLVFAIIFSGLAIYFYSNGSLENNGLFLMLPHARLPILIIGSLYTACCFATMPYPNLVKTSLLITYSVNFGVIVIITFSIGWLLFYKVKKLRRI